MTDIGIPQDLAARLIALASLVAKMDRQGDKVEFLSRQANILVSDIKEWASA